ncbi:efflux RND transporter periplasmic adaptor subunit [Paludibacterium paludis]|uniref:RND transporter n=1 Tax=Paludibacterium paludis TaxID=1225769 RepID=A0A918U860_9NEIS|nr:efflux RND transporter periplasmic adaptor subunit [Paludibacterium paludis]GGY07686.1 RND transporter [Paludibacterium paludis]
MLLSVILAASLAGCSKGDGQKTDGKVNKKTVVRELARTDFLTAKVGLVQDSLPFTGSLSALSKSLVSAAVEGKVLDVRVREGEKVRRGQVLAVLDNETLRQNVAEQEAQVANTQSRLKLARVKLEKQRELLQKGFISKLAFDELESEYNVRAGEFRAQEAGLARARKLLADTVVKAPIDGVMAERKINPGEQITANAQLFSIVDLNFLEVTATVPARLIPSLHTGMKAGFTVEGLAGEFAGELERINPVAVSGTRNFAIYVRVDNRDGRLKVGQFAKGKIVLREVRDQIALPMTAIQDPGSASWVEVVENGKLTKRPVTIVLQSEMDKLVAVKGVKPGEVVLSALLLGTKIGDAVSLPAKH